MYRLKLPPIATCCLKQARRTFRHRASDSSLKIEKTITLTIQHLYIIMPSCWEMFNTTKAVMCKLTCNFSARELGSSLSLKIQTGRRSSLGPGLLPLEENHLLADISGCITVGTVSKYTIIAGKEKGCKVDKWKWCTDWKKNSGHSWRVIRSFSPQAICGRSDTVEERVNNRTGWSVFPGWKAWGRKWEELRGCSGCGGRTCGSSKREVPARFTLV